MGGNHNKHIFIITLIVTLMIFVCYTFLFQLKTIKVQHKVPQPSARVSSDTPYGVPNIVHYIWYQNKPINFRFDQALSVLSAVKNIKPDAVYFYTNMEPKGKYYEMLKSIPLFKVIHREPPREILKNITFETDYADFDKVKIVMEKGGIYLDFDVMVTASFDNLRKYNCTMGLESSYKLCSGVIVCVKDHPFLYLWLNSYYDDFRHKWSYNSGVVSTRIMRRYKGLIHVEGRKLHRPSFKEVEKIWGKKLYPWKDNYSVHTWIRIARRRRLIKENPTPESIKTMNSTYGEMARSVYYGTSELIFQNKTVQQPKIFNFTSYVKPV